MLGGGQPLGNTRVPHIGVLRSTRQGRATSIPMAVVRWEGSCQLPAACSLPSRNPRQLAVFTTCRLSCPPLSKSSLTPTHAGTWGNGAVGWLARHRAPHSTARGDPCPCLTSRRGSVSGSRRARVRAASQPCTQRHGHCTGQLCHRGRASHGARCSEAQAHAAHGLAHPCAARCVHSRAGVPCVRCERSPMAASCG